MNKKENTPAKKKTHHANTPDKKNTPIKSRVTNKNSLLKSSDHDKKPQVVKRRLYTDSDRKEGARSKFDDVNEEIIERTREGLSKKDRVAGLIHEATYHEWLNAGDEDLLKGINSQYSEFSQKVKQAEKEYRKSLIDCIKKQAIDDWRAANWLLERSDPDTYKLRDKMDVKQEIEVSQKAILEIPNNKNRSMDIKND